jgi:Arc/MetJ-type ribon-helix-helix transcriptional regulator
VPFDAASLGAPSPRPRQVFAVALNYPPHAAEAGYVPPEIPLLFTKFPSSITGQSAQVLIPCWPAEALAPPSMNCHRALTRDFEAYSLGVPFPPLAERFERLEEAVQITLQMWRGDEARARRGSREPDGGGLGFGAAHGGVGGLGCTHAVEPCALLGREVSRPDPCYHDLTKGSISSMKVSVSLPEDDVEFLESYVREQGMDSRSAAVHKAVGLLRTAQLASAYENAWDSWTDSGDAEAWETVTADGSGA